MKFFRIELTSFGDENVILYVPSGKLDLDENGNPVYDESSIHNSQEFKDFVRRTETPIVDVHYELWEEIAEAEPAMQLSDAAFTEALQNENLKKIEENDYPVDVKKKKTGSIRKSSEKNGKLYIIVGCIILAAVLLIIFGSLPPAKSAEPEPPAETTAQEVEVTDITSTEAVETSEPPAETNNDVISNVAVDRGYVNITLIADSEDSSKTITVDYGEKVNLLQNYGFTQPDSFVSGWTNAGSSSPLSEITATEDIELYALWEEATDFITITLCYDYLQIDQVTTQVAIGMHSEATYTLPVVNDIEDVYNYVPGYTYGWTSAEPDFSSEYGTIEYFSGETYNFTSNITLYRVLNVYGGGNGTIDNPYIINRYDQLELLASSGAKGYYLQTADIEYPDGVTHKAIDTKTISAGTTNKNYDWFVYDGQNHSITNMTSDGGLFGSLSAATIKNVIVDGASITARGTVGVICNTVRSYPFIMSGVTTGSERFVTGNSRIEHCAVKNTTITPYITATEDGSSGSASSYIGGIIGSGGEIDGCYVDFLEIKSPKAATTSVTAIGGIAGSADTVNACIATNVTIEGIVIKAPSTTVPQPEASVDTLGFTVSSAGGIAGIAPGATVFLDDDRNGTPTGGKITGCAVVNLVLSNAVSCGGIVGSSCSFVENAIISSCYASNLVLNGTTAGAVSGSDFSFSEQYPYIHTISYCITDDTNGYEFIGGDNIRSVIRTIALRVAYIGFTVDGVLSIMNNRGAGYTDWHRSDLLFNGYAYPFATADFLPPVEEKQE